MKITRKISTPAWVSGRTVYEVNLRQYTPGGTISEFEEHLPRLKELGVGILWFMPVFPIGVKNRKGSLGSYYAISNYRQINPEFGSLADFKRVVRKIHDLGMKVIMDWVANHTAWDHHWTLDHPEYYTKNEMGGFQPPVPDWEDVIHLDYGNPDLWDEMISDMIFWLNEADVDGFRCDMAHLVPTLFWNRARRELDKVKPVFMLAESENHDLLEYAFDAIYNWKLLHAMNDLASGRLDAAGLLEIAANELKHLPGDSSLLNFTSNHDENSWQGSAIERIHYFLEPLTVLTFLLPGIPLIYSGQEAGNYRRLKFFDKDKIEWKEDKMSNLYYVLSDLKTKSAGAGSGLKLIRIRNDADSDIASFEITSGGTRIVVLLNLSGKDQSFYIACNDYDGNWRDVIKDLNTFLDCTKPLFLESYSFQVLIKTV